MTLKKKNFFTASSLVKVLHYLYYFQDSKLIISAVKDEILKYEKENFYLELLTFLNMQLNDVYCQVISSKDDVVYLSLEMSFLDKSFLMSTQVLKLNEYEVHLVIYDDKS